jgi:hypothetical protein
MSAKSHYTLTPSGSANRGVSETSIAAYESQDPDAKARRERQILGYIETEDGATCWEVEIALGLLHQSASSMITRLRQAGHLVDTGERRPTNTGRMATVWGLAA